MPLNYSKFEEGEDLLREYERLESEGIKWQERVNQINSKFGCSYTVNSIGKYMYKFRKKRESTLKEVNIISSKMADLWMDSSNWSTWWVKKVKLGDDEEYEGSILVKNPDFFWQSIFDSFDEICSKYEYQAPTSVLSDTKESTSNKALQVVISDSHVGLDCSDSWNSLFEYEYDGDIYKDKLLGIMPNILKEYNTHWKFEELYLIDLWDREDGLWGQTTRGGHSLPQNMSDIDVFETCIDAKLQLLQSIVEADIADRIIIRDVVNSNHSSAFAHMVSMATSKLINRIYDKFVTVEILGRYMEHRVYGDHCFIYTHGKDAKHQFKGLPLHLNDKASSFIRDYIDHYEIRARYIHVLKWDLHQIGFNKTKRFDYRNFPSFAPWSSWQQHNFGDSYSGYSIQVIPKHENEIAHTDYFIDYRRKGEKVE